MDRPGHRQPERRVDRRGRSTRGGTPRGRGLTLALAGLATMVVLAGPSRASAQEGRDGRDDREPTEESGILRVAPAELLVLAVSGARVTVDGVVVGATPFPRAIELEPGRHHIEVAANGFEPASREVFLTSGKATAVAVDLEPTTQRQIGWAFVGTGAAGIAAGVAFGVASVVEHRRAQDLPGDAEDGNAAEDVQREYDEAVAARDDFRVASGLGAGLGLGLFLVGGLLFTFDEPDASPAEDRVPGAARRRGAPRLVATPIATPDLAGGVATVRF